MASKTKGLIPDFKRVILVSEIRMVLRQNDKEPRKEKYSVEAKVFYSKNDDGTYDYYYCRDNEKVPVRWEPSAKLFIPVGDAT